MIFHMRTTLVIDQALFRHLKRLAAEQGRTLSGVTQDVLRLGLASLRQPGPRTRVKLPSFSMGRPAVDVADRSRLLDLLDER